MTSVPLRLDLVRHGEAESASEGGDFGRRLSPAGSATIAKLAERLAQENWRPAALWASPLVRAQETAAILATACPGLTVDTLEELEPDGDPEDVAAALDQHSATGHVVLVGHQPLMGRLVGWLAGDAERPFRPGSFVRLEIDGALHGGSARVTLELHPTTPRGL